MMSEREEYTPVLVKDITDGIPVELYFELHIDLVKYPSRFEVKVEDGRVLLCVWINYNKMRENWAFFYAAIIETMDFFSGAE